MLYPRFLACVTVAFMSVSASQNMTAQTATHAAASQSDTAVVIAKVTPKQGKLADLLKAQVAKATALGRTPFVELGATWCSLMPGSRRKPQ